MNAKKVRYTYEYEAKDNNCCTVYQCFLVQLHLLLDEGIDISLIFQVNRWPVFR